MNKSSAVWLLEPLEDVVFEVLFGGGIGGFQARIQHGDHATGASFGNDTVLGPDLLSFLPNWRRSCAEEFARDRAHVPVLRALHVRYHSIRVAHKSRLGERPVAYCTRPDVERMVYIRFR